MKLSEEEKKAIELLKKLQKKTPYIIWGDGTPYNKSNQIQTILNLIDKQQKEIEEKQKALDFSNKEIIKLKDMLIEKDKKIKDLSNYVYDKEYISKDKIRKYFAHEIAFKKRLQREKQKIDKYNRGRFNTIEEILELLEEEINE